VGEVRGVSISGAMDSGGGTDYASSPIAGGKRVKGKQDLRKRRGGVDGSGGAKTAGDGSDRGNNVWGITGDITDQTDTKKGSKTVPYDREYEEIKRPATSETFQIRGVGHHIGFVTPRILDGDLGSEGRLFSLQSERSSAEMGGVSMGRQGFQVPSSTVRLFPESVVFHKDHEGSAELLESARVTGGGLSGRFHPNSSLQGDRNLAAGPCDPAYLRSIGIGERNVKGLLGTIDQSPDIGPHFGFIKSDSGDPRRQAYVDPGTGKEIERARASGGSGGGKIGWKGDISGEGFPAGQSGNKIPLCVGGCGSQSTVGVGLQDSSIRASKAGCNLVSGKSAFIQRKAGVETIQSDCHADRCFPLRLGSSDWSAGRWGYQESHLHINSLELLAIKLAILSFQGDLRGCRVTIKTDSMTAKACLESGGCSDLLRNQITRDIWSLAISLDFLFSVDWIAGRMNQEADILSRQALTDDWSLKRTVFKQIHEYAGWGPFTIDRFADHQNTQLTRFNSRFFCPGSEAQDAFSQEWVGENNWLLPAPGLISRVLQQLQESRAKGVILVPEWKGQPWWPLLTQLAKGWYPISGRDFAPGPSGHVEVWRNPAWKFWAVLLEA